jgi:hypothetical protein
MKTKEGITIKKIYLTDFIDILIDLYDEGADYADMTFMPNGTEHMITIGVREEYMFTEDREDDEEKLTDESINQLI